MKTNFFILCLLLAGLYAAPATKVGTGGATKVGTGGATKVASAVVGYTLLYDTITGAAGSASVCGYVSNYYFFGSNVSDSTTRTIGKITFKLSTPGGGNISGKTYKVKLWNRSGTNLGTLIGTSAGVTGDNSWSSASVDFVFSPPVAVPTDYIYTLDPDGAAGNATDYVQIYYAAAGSCVSPYAVGTAGTSWWGTSGVFTDTIGSNVTQSFIYTSP